MNDYCMLSPSTFQGLRIECDSQQLELVRALQPPGCSYHSELSHLLGVSMVELALNTNGVLSITETEFDRLFCIRCRRKARREGEEFCDYCTQSLQSTTQATNEITVEL